MSMNQTEGPISFVVVDHNNSEMRTKDSAKNNTLIIAKHPLVVHQIWLHFLFIFVLVKYVKCVQNNDMN